MDCFWMPKLIQIVRSCLRNLNEQFSSVVIAFFNLFPYPPVPQPVIFPSERKTHNVCESLGWGRRRTGRSTVVGRFPTADKFRRPGPCTWNLCNACDQRDK